MNDYTLIQRTSARRFVTNNPQEVAEYLRGQGFVDISKQTPHQLTRLVRGTSVAVVYHNGGIVAGSESLIALLNAASAESAVRP